MKNIVGFTRNHLQNNLDLAQKFSKHPTETTKSIIEMLYNQSFGGVELLIGWLNYQRDPDNIQPSLIKLWDEYKKKFEELLK